MVSLDLLMLATPIQMLLAEFVLKVICLLIQLDSKMMLQIVVMVAAGVVFHMQTEPIMMIE